MATLLRCVLALFSLAICCQGALRHYRLPGRHHLEGAGTSACSCGVVNQRKVRLVGGQITEFNEYPWVVTLLLKGHNYCAGNLISDRYVLTAGHCLRGVDTRKLMVMVGDHMRDFPLETKSRAYKVVHKIVHPDFNPFTFESDIGLIKLSHPVPYAWNARPACLPVPERNFTGSMAIVAGWGKTEEIGEVSKYLREIEVPVISNVICQTLGFLTEEISENMMCAGYEYGQIDSCHGDSGGPLMVKARDNKMVLVGIVSWGEGCGRKDFPGVYTKVERFLDWIEQNTRDSCYCGKRTGRG